MAWLRWSFLGWLGWLGAVGALASATGCGDDDGDDTVDMASPDLGTDAFTEADAFTETDAFTDTDAFTETDGGSGTPLDSFEVDVATAKCAALFRCCDSDSIEDFFGQYGCIPGLSCPYEDQQDSIPPADMDACVAVMQELDEVTFGTWLTETRAGNVDFDETAHADCLDDLATASCGDELVAALEDITCFARIGNAAPGSVYEVQHTSFDRTAGVGEDCVTLYEEPYGTCDPAVAFCCVGGAGSCTTGGEGGDAGTCVAVASVDEECTQFPDQHCEPGLLCDPPSSIGETATCVAPTAPTALDEGDECLSASFESLGECTDSYCDNTSRMCEATLANGESCNSDQECSSGNCQVMGTPPIVDRECADPSYCIGT